MTYQQVINKRSVSWILVLGSFVNVFCCFVQFHPQIVGPVGGRNHAVAWPVSTCRAVRGPFCSRLKRRRKNRRESHGMFQVFRCQFVGTFPPKPASWGNKSRPATFTQKDLQSLPCYDPGVFTVHNLFYALFNYIIIYTFYKTIVYHTLYHHFIYILIYHLIFLHGEVPQNEKKSHRPDAWRVAWKRVPSPVPGPTLTVGDGLKPIGSMGLGYLPTWKP